MCDQVIHRLKFVHALLIDLETSLQATIVVQFIGIFSWQLVELWRNNTWVGPRMEICLDLVIPNSWQ